MPRGLFITFSTSLGYDVEKGCGFVGKELEQANKSLFFLTVLLGSILLSWQALWLQREGLCRGKEIDVSRLRLAASVLVVLSLAVFFCLALQGRREAEGTAGECSADINVLASLLVLLAALLRLGELLREPKNVPADHGGDVCQSFLCGLYSPVA